VAGGSFYKKCSAFGTGQQMDALTQLQQNRQIIEDFAEATLARIPTAFGRLTYLASLRDLATNIYEHAGLAAVYPPEAVRQALEQCHEEMFERILETPLTMQQEDLVSYLSSTSGGLRTAISSWRTLQTYRTLLPAEAPDYLKELFCSNLRAILEILEQALPASQPNE
jgi:hypothetical protein